MDHDRSEHGGDLLSRHYLQIRRSDAIRVFAENLQAGDVVAVGGGQFREVHDVDRDPRGVDGQPLGTGRWVRLIYSPPAGEQDPVTGIACRARDLVDAVVNQPPEAERA